MSKGDSMQTIDRAMKILKSFSVNDSELSLADLHRKLGVSKSSLQRILNTLVLQGVIDKDEKKKTYQLGFELYFLGQLVEKNSHLLSTSKPFMEKLRDEFGESVSLNIIYQKKRKCIGYVGGGHELTTITYIGQTSPLYAGASAKLLMAFLPSEELSDLLNELEFTKIAENTIMNKEDLMKELTKVYKEGYAVSWGERVKGAFSVSAPIRNRLNEVIAGVTIIIPTARVDEQKLNLYFENVKETALLISNKFN
ncbi:IclR family transcriptional regulator [Paenisporosarcina sp. TG-14]|uniref:IclR family transcriptional regulator n=1 Tax=Paenisporosarcina sp. TG-14 TaxID=1231057 RepID=UPI0002F8453A|nr:IclR family transcriptional regulator [Paenisporosarcina sp. TG-14]